MVEENIYIYPIALAKMIHHTSSNINKEVAGYLIGKVIDEKIVEITDIAIARQRGTSVHVTLNDEDQALIADRLEEEDLGEVIVGWYHSHPRMGAHFFSSTDIATQKRYQFFLKQAVGIVLDPHHYVMSGQPSDMDVHAWRIEDEKSASDIPFRIMMETDKSISNILEHLKRQNVIQRAVSQIIYSLNPKLEQSISEVIGMGVGSAGGTGKSFREVVLYGVFIQAFLMMGIFFTIWAILILIS